MLDLVDSMPPGMLKLAREADVVLCATEEGRAAWEAATERAVNVVPDTDPNDPLRPLRLLVEEPKRFGFKPATREDLQLLASLRRAPPEPEPPPRPGPARIATQRLRLGLRRRLARFRAMLHG